MSGTQIVNECYTIDLFMAFTDIKLKLGHFMLFARIKEGYSEFFKNVNVTVTDNFNKEQIQTYVSNKLSLEETTNT